tara:strand:- start:670 stop:1599 length:930 start_codon:yes stop_codon:yes gene_type:complete
MDHIKKFQNYTIEQFAEFHGQSFKNASKSTNKSFKQSLKRLEIIYNKKFEELELSFLYNAETTYDKLGTSDYSNNTLISTYTSILKILKLVDAPLNHYNKFLKVLNREGKKRDIDQLIDLDDKLKYLPKYQDIKTIIEKNIDDMFENIENIQFYEIKNLLVLSLFVLTIPMKLSNYLSMKIIYDTSSIKENLNYILDDDGIFTLVFKENTILITSERLNKLIKIWLDEFNSSKYLLIDNNIKQQKLGQKGIRIALSIGSKSILGSELTDIDLRSIFMKDLMKNDPNLKQKIMLSNLLGYQNLSKLEDHK